MTNSSQPDTKKPDVLVDVYGNRPPRAAEFGKGARDISEINDATEAQRNVKPGEYDHRR